MNRPHEHGDLPEPVRRYWMELRRTDPPMELLDQVVAELEQAPRPMRFAFIPVAGLMAAAAVAIAVITFSLWPNESRPIGGEETARPAHSGEADSPSPATGQPSPTLRPGVIPITADPPLSAVAALEADISETTVGRLGGPSLVAHGSVWFGDSQTGRLTRVDATTGEVSAVIDISPDPTTDAWDALAVADERWVYAAALDETLVQIDPATNEIVERFPIGTLPYRMELHDGDAYITDLDGGQVTRVDLSTGEVLWQVRGGVRPGGLEITDDAVWVASYGDARLHRLDPETGEVLEEYPTYLYGMEVLHDGADALYITGNQGRPLERFSISEGRVTARIEEITAVIHEGQLYGLRPQGLILLDPTTLEWRALAEVDALEGEMVAGEGAVWIYESDRLHKVQPSP